MASLNYLLKPKRIVIKYGTNALTRIDGDGKVLGLDMGKIGA